MKNYTDPAQLRAYCQSKETIKRTPNFLETIPLIVSATGVLDKIPQSTDD
jgi:hypothetical protein